MCGGERSLGVNKGYAAHGMKWAGVRKIWNCGGAEGREWEVGYIERGCSNCGAGRGANGQVV